MNRSDSLAAASSATAPAVVVGLDNITGLQTARILAERGVPVVGVAADRTHFGARTRACVEVIESPLSGDALISSLRDLGRRLGRTAVLFPCTDASVSLLSRRRDELTEYFRLPLPRHDVVDQLMDKVRFAQYAAGAGLSIPHTEVFRGRAEAERAAARLRYPCIVKPPMKSPEWLRHTTSKGFSVNNADELLAIHDRVSPWSEQLIAQVWVEGGEGDLFSCNAYFGSGGEPLATFVARKVRQWPPHVGTSASGEECRNDEVLDQAVRLFSGAGFHGLAYLEMKRDSRTGQMFIIEPNVGRPTGRSAIAEAGGVELVYTAYCDAMELPLPAARVQRYVGAKWLDLRRDAQAAIAARRRGELTSTQWIRSLRGHKAHAIWSRRDPMPFVVDVAHALGQSGRILVARAPSVASRAGADQHDAVRRTVGHGRAERR